MTSTFTNFPYRADELSAYIFSIDTFVISLKTGEVIHHTTEEHTAFEAWLQHHRIRNVRDGLPQHIIDALFRKP